MAQPNYGFSNGASTAPVEDDTIDQTVVDTPVDTPVDTDEGFGFSNFTPTTVDQVEAEDRRDDAVNLTDDQSEDVLNAAEEKSLNLFVKADNMDDDLRKLFLGDRYEDFVHWKASGDTTPDQGDVLFGEAYRRRRNEEDFYDDNQDLQEILKPTVSREQFEAQNIYDTAKDQVDKSFAIAEQSAAKLDEISEQILSLKENGEEINFELHRDYKMAAIVNREHALDLIGSNADYGKAFYLNADAEMFADNVKRDYGLYDRARHSIAQTGDQLGLTWFTALDVVFDNPWIDREIKENTEEIIGHNKYAEEGLERSLDMSEIEGPVDFLEWFTEGAIDSLPTTALIVASIGLDIASFATGGFLAPVSLKFNMAMLPGLFVLGASGKQAEFVYQEYKSENFLKDIDKRISEATTYREEQALKKEKERHLYVRDRTNINKFLQASAYGIAEIAFARLGVVGTVGKTSKLAAGLGKATRSKFVKRYAGKWIERFNKSKTKLKPIVKPVPLSKQLAESFPKLASKLQGETTGKILGPIATFTSEFLKEGIEESLTQISQNLVDISLDQQEKSLLEGVPEAFILGGGLGGILGSASVGVRTHLIKPALTKQYQEMLAYEYQNLLQTNSKLFSEYDKLNVEERDRLIDKSFEIMDRMTKINDIVEENALSIPAKEFLLAHEYEGQVRKYTTELEKLKATGKTDEETTQSIHELNHKISTFEQARDSITQASLTDADIRIMSNIDSESYSNINAVEEKITYSIHKLRSEIDALIKMNTESPSESIASMIDDRTITLENNQKHADLIKEGLEKREEIEAKDREEKDKRDKKAGENVGKTKSRVNKDTKTFTPKETDKTKIISSGIGEDERVRNKKPSKTKKKGKEDKEEEKKEETPQYKAKDTKSKKDKLDQTEAEVLLLERLIYRTKEDKTKTEKELEGIDKSREAKRVKRFRNELENKKRNLKKSQELADNITKLIENPSDSKIAKDIVDNAEDDIEPIILFMSISTDAESAAEAIDSIRDAIQNSTELTKAEKKTQIENLSKTDKWSIAETQSRERIRQLVYESPDGKYDLQSVDELLLRLDLIEQFKEGFEGVTDGFKSLLGKKGYKSDEISLEELKIALDKQKADNERSNKVLGEVETVVQSYIDEKARKRAGRGGGSKAANKYLKHFTIEDFLDIAVTELTGLEDHDLSVNFATLRTFEFLFGKAAINHLKTKDVYDEFVNEQSLKLAPNDIKILQLQEMTPNEIKRRESDKRTLAIGSLILQPFLGPNGLLSSRRGHKGKGESTYRVKDLTAFKKTDLYESFKTLQKRGDISISGKWLEGEDFYFHIHDDGVFDNDLGFKNLNKMGLRGDIIAQVATWKAADSELLKNDKTFRQPDSSEIPRADFYKSRQPVTVRVKTRIIKSSTGVEIDKQNRLNDFAFAMYVSNPKYKSGVAKNRQVQSKVVNAKDYDKLGLDKIRHSSKTQMDRYNKTTKPDEQLTEAGSQSYTVNNADHKLFDYLTSVGYFDNNKESKQVRKDKAHDLSIILDISKGLIESPGFFVPHYFDTRGRMGSYVKYFNHQGNKVAKALYSFSESKVIDETGFVQTMAQIVDYLGKGYDVTMPDGTVVPSGGMTTKDRFRMGLALWKDVAMVVEDPNSAKSKSLLAHAKENGDKEDFVAIALEANKILKWTQGKGNGDPTTYPSNFVMWKDATVSGAQNLAALTFDSFTAKLVNLSDNYRKFDLYTMVGRFAHLKLEVAEVTDEDYDISQDDLDKFEKAGKSFEQRYKDAAFTPKKKVNRRPDQETQAQVIKELNEFLNDEEFEKTAKVYFGGKGRLKKTRNLAKGSTMIKFYNASPYTMALQLVDEMSVKEGFEDISLPLAFWLTKEIATQAEKYAPGPTVAQKTFKFIVGEMHKYEDDLRDQGVKDFLHPLQLDGFFNEFPFEQSYDDIKDITTEGLAEQLGIPEAEVKKPSQSSIVNQGNRSLEFQDKIQQGLRHGPRYRDKQQSNTAGSPNYTHHLDSQPIAAFYQIDGINKLAVHDNFGTHSVDAEFMRESVLNSMAELYEGELYNKDSEVGDGMTRMIVQTYSAIKDVEKRNELIDSGISKYKKLRNKLMINPDTGDRIPIFDLNEMSSNLYGLGSQGGNDFLPYHKQDSTEIKVFFDKVYPKLKETEQRNIDEAIDKLAQEQKDRC